MSIQDVSSWLPKAAAANKLGISIRALERKIEAREIETAPRSRHGKRPETVCNPDDVDRLMPTPHVMPAASAAMTAPSEKSSPAAALEIMAMLAAARAPKQQEQRRWLTIDEAAEHSGISIRTLQLATKDETHRQALGAWRDGNKWKIDRAKLDSYTPSELPQLERKSPIRKGEESPA